MFRVTLPMTRDSTSGPSGSGIRTQGERVVGPIPTSGPEDETGIASLKRTSIDDR